MSTELTDVMRKTVRSGARKLTGFRRRQFQAEVTLQFCQGNARQAERIFGWGRDAVHTGLNELRSGIRCVDNFRGRGRWKSEAQNPALVRQIQAIVEPESQADPKFQSPIAFTRITAQAVHEQLVDQASNPQQHTPAVRTVHDILNRLGYRLRRVRKTKPQKNSPKPMLFLRT